LFNKPGKPQLAAKRSEKNFLLFSDTRLPLYILFITGFQVVTGWVTIWQLPYFMKFGAGD